MINHIENGTPNGGDNTATIDNEINNENDNDDDQNGCQGCCACPYGQREGAILISLVLVAYIFANQATGNCQFLVVKILEESEEPAGLEDFYDFGLLRYRPSSTSGYNYNNGQQTCILWNDKEQNDSALLEQDALWGIVSKLTLVTSLLSLLFAIGTCTTSCVRYDRKVLSHFVILGMIVPLLYGLTFMVYGSDICKVDDTQCSVGSGTLFMVVALPAWLLALYYLDRVSSPLQGTRLPSTRYMEAAAVTSVVIILVNLLVVHLGQVSANVSSATLLTGTSPPVILDIPTVSPGNDGAPTPTNGLPQEPSFVLFPDDGPFPTKPPLIPWQPRSNADQLKDLDFDNLSTKYEWREVLVTQEELGLDYSVEFDEKYTMSGDGQRVALTLRRRSGDGTSAEFVAVYEVENCQNQWRRVGGDIFAANDQGNPNGYSGYCSLEINYDGTRFVVGNCGYGYGLGLVEVWSWTAHNLSWERIGSFLGETYQDESSTRQGLGFAVTISDDGSRIGMTATPGQSGTPEPRPPEGFARILEWNGSEWDPIGEDLRLIDVNTMWGGFEETLQYTHIDLSGDGNYALVVGRIPFTFYLQTFQLSTNSNTSQPEWIPWNAMEYPVSDPEYISVDLSFVGHRLALGWKNYSTISGFGANATVMEAQGDGIWVDTVKGPPFSEIEYHWTSDIVISRDGDRVAVRARDGSNPDRVGIASLAYNSSTGSWGIIGSSMFLKDHDRIFTSVRISGDGNTIFLGNACEFCPPRLYFFTLHQVEAE